MPKIFLIFSLSLIITIIFGIFAASVSFKSQIFLIFGSFKTLIDELVLKISKSRIIFLKIFLFFIKYSMSRAMKYWVKCAVQAIQCNLQLQLTVDFRQAVLVGGMPSKVIPLLPLFGNVPVFSRNSIYPTIRFWPVWQFHIHRYVNSHLLELFVIH